MILAEKHHSARVRAGRLLTRLLGPLLLLGICICFFWKLLLTNQYTWLSSPDLAFQVLPWYQFQAGEWHAGRIPLWDPYEWLGQSLIGQAQPGAANPLNWLLFWLPLKDGWMRTKYLHWYFVVIHVIAAWAMYALCRDRGRSRAAAVLGGLVFALGGYVGSNDWPQMLNGAIWAPLIVMFSLRAMEGRAPWSSAVLSGLFWGLSWLSGHHQIPIFLSLAIGAVWAYHLAAQRGQRRAHLWLAAATLGIAILVGALQTLPAFEYGQRARRWVGAEEPVGWKDAVPYYVHQQYSLPPQALLNLVLPGLDQNGAPFIGFAGFSLAAFAVAVCWPESALFAALAVGGLLFAMGDVLLVHGVLYSLVPMVEKARSPGMAVVLVTLGGAPLAACGLDALCRRPLNVWARKFSLGLAAAAALVFGTVVVLTLARVPLVNDRIYISAIMLVFLAVIWAAAQRQSLQPRQTAFLLASVALIELSAGSPHRFMHRIEKNRNILRPMKEHPEVLRFLQGQPGLFRVLRDDKEISYNLGDWYAVEEPTGYLASVTQNTLVLEMGLDRVEQLLGVRYYVGKAPFRRMQKLVLQGADGLNVYADAEAFPRAFAVRDVMHVDHAGEVSAFLANPDHNLRELAVSTSRLPVPPPCRSTGSVEVRRHVANHVQLEASLPCSQVVVITNSYDPGWHAKVDGQSTPLFQVDGALWGVVVPAGQHWVDVRYLPWPVVLGAAMTLAGLALVVGVVRWEGRRLRRLPAPLQ